jgi:hypothetical protein
MKNNPYAPPTTEVADISPMNKWPQPRQVYWAVALLWVSLLLGLLAIVLAIEREGGDTAILAWVLGFQLVFVVLAAYLNVCIYRGRNWARITFLVLFFISLVIVVFVPNPPEFTLAERVTDVVAVLLDMVAAVLLFTKPGSLWFKAVPRA